VRIEDRSASLKYVAREHLEDAMAVVELLELLTAKVKIMRGYGTWLTSLLQKAGCAIRTVDKPWSQRSASCCLQRTY
jgi:hypothetical protein